MGPMFPRLHVNDTEKGGPRAPPRNKMALYEQLSIPSQRFNPNLIPPQGNGHERSMLFPLHLPSPRTSAEKLHACCSDSTQLTQFESRKKAVGDDSRVCIIVNSSTDQGPGKFYSKSDWEKLAPSSPAGSVCLNKGSKLNIGINTRQHKSPKQVVAIRGQPVKAALSATATDKPVRPSKQTDVLLEYDLSGPLDKNGINLQPENMDDSHVGSFNGDATIIRDVEDGNSSILMRDFQTEEQMITINLVSDTESQKDKGYKSLRTGNVCPGEDSSETSMVGCISGVAIIPDDIVGLIGKNHFWKARKSIIHQQRLFAFQVFELHRLIKVQKLIAGSPNLLDGSAYLAKSLKRSSAKSLPLEYIVKEPQDVSKHKNDLEVPEFRMEFSAENTTRKASFSSVQNGDQPPLSCRPFSGNPTVAAINNESEMGPWCFHQPAGHQWLIPVMTPSEGLVYKPYPGPGFMAPVCGGCGSPGLSPVKGHFPVPAYQGMGVPFAPPAFNGYFPPYGMNPAISTSGVEEMKQFAGMGSQGQVSGGANSNSNSQHQNSCHVRNQKKTAAPNLGILHPFMENEVQASTASSPSEKSPGVVPVVSTEMERRGGALCLSSTSTARYAHHQPTRVIRAVPRHARSATESAARIFQSIQEERKQYD
nr:protein EARLY FLOWERING 3-like [Ipomoea batatas]